MLRILEAVRKEPPDIFLYLTHIYPKNSVNYNFYNVK